MCHLLITGGSGWIGFGGCLVVTLFCLQSQERTSWSVIKTSDSSGKGSPWLGLPWGWRVKEEKEKTSELQDLLKYLSERLFFTRLSKKKVSCVLNMWTYLAPTLVLEDARRAVDISFILLPSWTSFQGIRCKRDAIWHLWWRQIEKCQNISCGDQEKRSDTWATAFWTKEGKIAQVNAGTSFILSSSPSPGSEETPGGASYKNTQWVDVSWFLNYFCLSLSGSPGECAWLAEHQEMQNSWSRGTIWDRWLPAST